MKKIKVTEIVCLHCHTAFMVDETGYAEILKQVHEKNVRRNWDKGSRLLKLTIG